MKHLVRWQSPRLQREVTVARWGIFGMPVLLFPTAGGDAEEIERCHLVHSVSQLITEGRIKVYSCDSIAGRAMLSHEGSPHHRMWLLNQFHDFVYHELVPAIRTDCQTEEIEIIAGGASIGAFNALAAVCRYPEIFRSALCMSGTYNLQKQLENAWSDDLYYASPIHFVPNLEGDTLEALRKRFVLFACGQGQWEDIGETWHAAHVLGSKEVPNRVDAWGHEWDHEWETWRRMTPLYLDELTRQE